jgi:methylated-DNA-[protein]-cysteine S-methyltransferase
MKEILIQKKFSSPVGELVAVTSATALCFLEFDGPKRAKLMQQRLDGWFDGAEIKEGVSPLLKKVGRWLESYFEGDFESLVIPPLDGRGSAFEKSVWREMLTIPTGNVLSYGQLGSQLGRPTAARAVGGASRRNPIALIVPCHRVVGSSGSLTGYGGGMAHKAWLLDHEASRFSVPSRRKPQYSHT